MCIVNVTHLETCSFTGKTTWPQCGQSSFVCNLGQRVRLVHELGQLVGSEERIDHGRQCLCVDQIYRCKHFVVTNVHTLTDGTCHTCQTYAKLLGQLLPNGSNTTVGQVIDIINLRFGVDQLDQIFNNGDDIFFGQNLFVHSDIQSQFFVHSVTTYLT